MNPLLGPRRKKAQHKTLDRNSRQEQNPEKHGERERDYGDSTPKKCSRALFMAR